MRVLCKIAMLVLMCCLLVGCGEYIKEGELLEKNFVPAHDEDEQVDYGDGIVMNETEHIPDRWYVTIGKKCEDGNYRTREAEVDQDVYNRYKKGDWVNFK